MAGLPYDGEPVDQLEHALQCAALARARARRRRRVRGRRLLHDIARAPAVAGIPYDGPREHHGEAGARWLSRASARASPGSQSSTSPPSATSSRPTRVPRAPERGLGADAGRAGRPDERRRRSSAFRRNPTGALAVALREIDDRGKVPGVEVPGLDAYRVALTVVVGASATSAAIGC